MESANTTKLSQLVQSLTPNERLNQRQAAAYLGRTSEWLRLRRHAGDGPPFTVHGREKFYLRADLDAWMASRRKAVKS